MRTVMYDIYEDSIQNWCLPLNHTIDTKHIKTPDFANVGKACRRLGGPFNQNLIN